MTGGSIFFHPDWILPRYAGWQTLRRDTDCLILVKSRCSVRRVCILSLLPAAHFFQRYDLAPFCGATTLLTLKIIPQDNAATPIAAARGLTPTPDAQRMFHKFTFVIDLTAPIEQLWMAMRPGNRNLCRKAEQVEVAVRIESAPVVADIDRFYELYGAMARTRNLAIPRREMLEAMFADRRLILTCAQLDGAVLSMALVYLAGDTAMYLYGVSPEREVDGAGQLLQWEVIRALKERGIRRYDLGGVPRVEEGDGIYMFKKGFGGLGVALGPEFYRTPAWFQFMRRCRQWLRRGSASL